MNIQNTYLTIHLIHSLQCTIVQPVKKLQKFRFHVLGDRQCTLQLRPVYILLA